MKRRSEASRLPMTGLAAVTILSYCRTIAVSTNPTIVDRSTGRLMRFWDRLPSDEDHAEAVRFLADLNPAAFRGRTA